MQGTILILGLICGFVAGVQIADKAAPSVLTAMYWKAGMAGAMIGFSLSQFIVGLIKEEIDNWAKQKRKSDAETD